MDEVRREVKENTFFQSRNPDETNNQIKSIISNDKNTNSGKKS